MLNKAIIMGRLTKDPELKQTQSGVSVCSFTVAVERSFVPQGGERQADFINCVAWRGTAEFICKWFAKGRMINVVGSIQTRHWDDQEGKRHYSTEVVADEVNFCGDGKREGGDNNHANGSNNFSAPYNAPAAPQNNGEEGGFVTVNIDDDLPF
jgi:single-strand DNA-binding protein